MREQSIRGQLLASTVVGLMGLAACAAKTAAPETAKTDEAVVAAPAPEKFECGGVNSCKGKGECGGKGHGCSGQNKCKGKGWIALTKEECKAKKGKVGSKVDK